LAGIAPATCSLAGVAFTNFPPGYGFSSAEWPVHGPLTGPAYAEAFQFTSGETGTLETIKLPLAYVDGTDSFTVSLLNDVDNTVGSTVLATWTQSFPNFALGLVSVLQDSNPATQLTAGTNYWLVASAAAPEAEGVWYGNSTGEVGLWGYSIDDGATFQSKGDASEGAMEIDVTAVPEPLSFAALAAGLGLLFARRRKGQAPE
jgi:hypothetical protein